MANQESVATNTLLSGARDRTLSRDDAATAPLHRESDMLYEGGGVSQPRVLEQQAPPSAADFDARSEAALPASRLSRWLEGFSRTWGRERLRQLVQKKGRLARSLDQVPRNMHLVANQTELVLELLDDFRTGKYRRVSWRSVALLVFGVLYSVSPADVIPDALPLIGSLDDLSVLAVVTRSVHADLRAYCRFKGYDEGRYFRNA